MPKHLKHLNMPTWGWIVIVSVILIIIVVAIVIIKKKKTAVVAKTTTTSSNKSQNVATALGGLSDVFTNLGGLFSSKSSGINGSDQSGITAAQVDAGETPEQTAANDAAAAAQVDSFLNG